MIGYMSHLARTTMKDVDGQDVRPDIPIHADLLNKTAETVKGLVRSAPDIRKRFLAQEPAMEGEETEEARVMEDLGIARGGDGASCKETIGSCESTVSTKLYSKIWQVVSLQYLAIVYESCLIGPPKHLLLRVERSHDVRGSWLEGFRV